MNRSQGNGKLGSLFRVTCGHSVADVVDSIKKTAPEFGLVVRHVFELTVLTVTSLATTLSMAYSQRTMTPSMRLWKLVSCFDLRRDAARADMAQAAGAVTRYPVEAGGGAET